MSGAHVKTERRWLSQEQVAEYLGVSVITVRRMASRGDLRAMRMGPRLLRYDAREIDRMLTPILGGQ
ncbi:MAG: helix-turn-helix domain-containing protein [Actinobacteria bacterium]|nr:helix-turn-helix domain-containing protein [Actinomycetota bacterium]